jgi:hypothetical protein
MPYNQILAQRMRTTSDAHDAVDKKKMCDRRAFICNDNMCCGSIHDEIRVGVGPKHSEVPSA